MEALKCQIIDSATDRQTLDLLENHYMTKLKTLGEGRLNLKLNAVPPAAVDQFLVDGKIGLTELTNPHLFKHLVTGAGSSPDGGATGQEDEVEKLRAKIEKLEAERNDLKSTCDKHESRISDLTADLSDEHSAATLAAERLEAVQADRVKLEKEKLELVAKNRHLTNTNERLEMEVLHSRALDMNGGHESDDDEANASVYKGKYDRAMKDLEFTKRRMTQQHEDDLEQLATVKKQLEKKLNDAYEEVEDQRQVVAQWKSQLETQVGRLKETIERLNKEVDDIRIREQSRQDQQKKMGRQLRDLKEDYATLQGKESDLVQKNGDLEKQIEVSDVEVMTLKSDLKLAMKSIEDLQVAISGDIEDDA